MNCDQVFAILTRGPFPSGDATDRIVEHHLSTCHECRHFADALRPHDSTEAESLLPEESRGLPFYWGVGALTAGESLVSTAVGGRSRSRHRPNPTIFQKAAPLERLSGWQLAFAVLVGALLGTLLRLIGTSDAPPHEVASNIPLAQASETRTERLGRIEHQLIDKLGVFPACLDRRFNSLDSADEHYNRRYDPSHPSLANDGASNHVHCCVECHNPTAPRLALESSTAKIIRSCQVCHKETVPD